MYSGCNDPKMLLYADDTIVYFAHSELSELQTKISQGLQKLGEWCKQNKLTINISKTKYQIFKPKGKNLSTDFYLNIGKVRLEEMNSYNYLKYNK